MLNPSGLYQNDPYSSVSFGVGFFFQRLAMNHRWLVLLVLGDPSRARQLDHACRWKTYGQWQIRIFSAQPPKPLKRAQFRPDFIGLGQGPESNSTFP
jgi:hypothetical protein